MKNVPVSMPTNQKEIWTSHYRIDDEIGFKAHFCQTSQMRWPCVYSKIKGGIHFKSVQPSLLKDHGSDVCMLETSLSCTISPKRETLIVHCLYSWIITDPQEIGEAPLFSPYSILSSYLLKLFIPIGYQPLQNRASSSLQRFTKNLCFVESI